MVKWKKNGDSKAMSCCGAPNLAGYGGLYPPGYGGFFTGFNSCNGLYVEQGGGWSGWAQYGSPTTGFRGCQNQLFVGLGGDGSGVGF